MFDTDGDGKVDQVKATFGETLATYTAGTAPWTLGERSGRRVEHALDACPWPRPSRR